MQFTVKLKNTGTCAAVFSTCSTDNLSIGLGSGTGTGIKTGTERAVKTGTGTDTGKGVSVEQDLELTFVPQRVSDRVSEWDITKHS